MKGEVTHWKENFISHSSVATACVNGIAVFPAWFTE